MARYHLNWEIEPARMAADPQEIANSWKALAGMVKKDFEAGALKDWGAYPGERKGYAVVEGSEMDVLRFTMQYAPYVAFDVRPATNIDEVMEFLVSASG